MIHNSLTITSLYRVTLVLNIIKKENNIHFTVLFHPRRHNITEIFAR